jgi:hypothetical protein
MMLGYSKEKFDCIIGYIENSIAYVELTDKDGEKSFMEIPKGDLKTYNVIFKVGSRFIFVLRQFLGWEKIRFKPLVLRTYTKEQIEETRKYYEEQYGDV